MFDESKDQYSERTWFMPPEPVPADPGRDEDPARCAAEPDEPWWEDEDGEDYDDDYDDYAEVVAESREAAELGQQLLDRSGRSIRLTEAGSVVLPFARAALDAVANARLAVDELVGLVRGQVTVGMVSGCALPVMAELLAGFHRRYPGVAITLTEDNSDRLVARLRDGQLDLALIGSAGEALPGVEAAVIVDEELVAAVDPGHPLAGSGAITVGALRDLPLVSLPRGTGVRAALDAACAEAGFTPRIVFEASALPMVVHMAARGLGLAVVPASTANAPQILRITRPQIRSRLELAWNSEPSANPAVRVLVEHAHALVRRPS